MEQMGTEDQDFIDMPDKCLTCQSQECTMQIKRNNAKCVVILNLSNRYIQID